MTKKKESHLAIHTEALQQFDKIQDALRDEREQCLKDRRFYSIAGGQWEGALNDIFENKPRFEINKIHLAVIRIINDYRNNRITVNFIPKDGVNNDSLSDACDGVYRSTEEDSDAEEAYDNAFEEAVGGGFGAFRLRSEYEDEEDEDNEYQRIIIEPIYDADTSVFFDINSKKYDKSDAKFCFVLSAFTKQYYIDEWDDNPVSWPKYTTRTTRYDWNSADVVYVAEYYRIEEVYEKIYIYETVDGKTEKYTEADFENNEKLQETLESIGTSFIKERKIKRKKIHKYLLSGGGILEDHGYIAGREIPIVPVYGKRWYVDNIERCMGAVRLAKDPQRIYNMLASKLGEISELSTVEKPIVTPEQMVGHENMWEEDNIRNWPYLLLNPVKDMQGNEQSMPPLAYTKVPNVPPALAALLTIMNIDMKEILGNQEMGDKITPNLSGKAIELVQNRLDGQSFIYMSNMAKSIKRSGKIWLSMASELFVEEGRKLKSIGKKDKVNHIELMKPKMNPDTNETEYENDFSKVKMDIKVTVGPSSLSRRESIVRSLTGMLDKIRDPETMQVFIGMIVMNMEGEGIEDVREYFRQQMLRTGVVKPTEEESKQLEQERANRPPDANAEFLKAAAQKEKALAAKNEADAILAMEKVEETKARTEKTQVESLEKLVDIDKTDEKYSVTPASKGRLDNKALNTAVDNKLNNLSSDTGVSPLTQIETQESQPLNVEQSQRPDALTSE